jgi:hypothetical protein
MPCSILAAFHRLIADRGQTAKTITIAATLATDPSCSTRRRVIGAFVAGKWQGRPASDLPATLAA